MPTCTPAMGSREEQAQSHDLVIRTDLCHLFLQTHPQLLGSRVQSSNQLLGEPDITESFSCLIHGHSRILQESTSPLSVCRLWNFLFSLDTQVLCLRVLSAVCACVCVCVCVCVFALSHSVLSDSVDPRDGSSTGSPVHGFSRQEYWIEPESPVSPVLQEDSIATEPSGKPSSQLHSCSNTPNVAQIRLYSIIV